MSTTRETQGRRWTKITRNLNKKIIYILYNIVTDLPEKGNEVNVDVDKADPLREVDDANRGLNTRTQGIL